MTLHIVHIDTNLEPLTECLRFTRDNDDVALLLEHNQHALLPEAQAHSAKKNIEAHIVYVANTAQTQQSNAQLVALCCKHDKVQSWY